MSAEKTGRRVLLTYLMKILKPPTYNHYTFFFLNLESGPVAYQNALFTKLHFVQNVSGQL